MKFSNLSGKIFGRWTVTSPVKNKHGRFSWKCMCKCGNKGRVDGVMLRAGKSKSCGCYRNDVVAKRSFVHGHSINRTASREYQTWSKMISRCENQNDIEYKNYGGRGISVCKRWRKSFLSFFKSMGKKPKGLTIERVDNDGNYKPSNCIWATQAVQTSNTRRNRFLTKDGITLTVMQWSKKLNVNSQMLYQRLFRKWPTKRVLCVR